MTRAHIGPNDLHLFDSPRPDLLRAITGIKPEAAGDHVRLDRHTEVRLAQRIALGAIGTGFIVGFWPAELKPQAEFLYRDGRAQAILDAATASSWETSPSPQLAFCTSPPSQRLYIHPQISAAEYAGRWERTDGNWVGGHRNEAVRARLWPWLKGRGFVTDEDDAVLDEFLAILGKRPAHLRPGLRLRKRWSEQEKITADAIRDDLNTILVAAGDSPL